MGLAAVTLASSARADALDDAIAREVCGTTASGDPACTVGAQAAAAFAGRQKHDDERPPAPPAAPPDPVVVLGPDLERDLHWAGAVAIQLGSAKVDGQDLDYVVGVTAAGGIQLDRLSVLGEYTVSGVEFHGTVVASPRGGMPTVSDTDGVMQRLGLVARYAFVKGATPPELGAVRSIGELWIEAGAGEQHTAWDKGGVLERPDFTLGVGMTGALRGLHRNGMSAAFRVYFAHRTDLDPTPTCSAPCTEATPPAPWSDRAFMIEVGYPFGG